MGSILLEITKALFVTLWARLRRGPVRPGWKLRTELVAGVLRGLMMASKRRGIPWLRGTMSRAPGLAPARRCAHFESAQPAGVPSTWWVAEGGSSGASTLLYLHGGGYVIGSPEGHGDLLATLAVEAGVRVLAPDYRLAPEHPFPAAQEDAIAVYRALLDGGVEPTRLAVAGDSAGGALALATALQARNAGDPLPGALVLLCPWVDPTARGGSLEGNADADFMDRELLDGWFRAALGSADPANPLWTPANADLSGLPPMLVQWGGAEVLRDQIQRFVERARAAGVDTTAREWEETFHDWMLLGPLVPEAGEAVEQIAEFLAKKLAG